MKIKRDKSGQQSIGMSFGMIFAIFMIVVFLVVAFMAIRGFTDGGESIKVGTFWKDLQDEINDAWSGQSSETQFEVSLPAGAEMVCFADLSGRVTGSRAVYDEIKDFEFYGANAFIIPASAAEGFEFRVLEHIDIVKTTEESNPYCVRNGENLIIEKSFYDKLVTIR
jgi:hypothetical protein